MLVDGVHFLFSNMPPHSIGHRAMAANLSDLAAMGARPVLATVALGVAPNTTEAWILEAYRGMATLAAEYGTRIVGGDIVRAPAAVFSVTVVGEVSTGRLKRRDGGRAGDTLAVTGPLGASRAGLELVRNGKRFAGERFADALQTFCAPVPRIREGAWLAASRAVHAMMDLSDGLSTDVQRLARASGCGAVLEEVPVHAAAVAVASETSADPREWALSGGEDFELALAVAPRAFPYLAGRFAARFGRRLYAVGRLTASEGLFVAEPGGQPEPLQARGWDHLRS